MRYCPRCGMGMEWGRGEDKKYIFYYWRCSHCGYKGDIIWMKKKNQS